MKNDFARAAGHWYDRTGKPAYEQPNKSKPGEFRPTTLRDAKKLDLVPSVTGIIKMADKPALNRWMMGEVMKAALTIPAEPDESASDYEARLWEESSRVGRESAEKGTKIHGYIEAFYQNGTVTDEGKPFIESVTTAIREHFGEQVWSAEKSFASQLGFGGKIDLHSHSVILDYKTKENNKFDFKESMTYIENKMQLSAYRKGLELPEALIANVYIGRDLQEDGTALVKIETHNEDHWQHFECLLNYWKLCKGIV